MRERLKEEVKVANNLIKAAVKFAEQYEPESILFARDLGSLAALMARQDAYIDELEEKIDRYERAFKDRREIIKQGK